MITPFELGARKTTSVFKTFTAFMESIAFPKSAWSLSNTGSPNPAGSPCTTQDIVPPIVSPSFLV